MTRTGPTSRVEGFVETGFEGVRDQFEANFAAGREVGAAAAVYVDGKLVVDLWGGLADPETDRPWLRDTPALVYSATKGAAAVVVHRLAQRGFLDLDEPVARYWPEFASAGKDRITVSQLLSHQAGLPVLDHPLTRPQLLAGTPVVEALSRQPPLWQPGAMHGYHALTFGWLVGELVSRVTGRTLGAEFADEVATPLGLEFWIGLPPERDHSVAVLVDGVPDPAELASITDPVIKGAITKSLAALKDPTSLYYRVLTTNGVLPTPDGATWNDPAVHAVEQPAANGITTAQSLARMYAACVSPIDGHRLLTAPTLERACHQQAHGPDAVTFRETRFSTGFQLPTAATPMLGDGSFGHAGAGGALGFGDVTHAVGFGYVPNKAGASRLGDPRTSVLIDALRQALT